MEEEKQEEKKATRREVLRKAKNAAVFVVPTILIFDVTVCNVAASNGTDPHAPARW